MNIENCFLEWNIFSLKKKWGKRSTLANKLQFEKEKNLINICKAGWDSLKCIINFRFAGTDSHFVLFHDEQLFMDEVDKSDAFLEEIFKNNLANFHPFPDLGRLLQKG